MKNEKYDGTNGLDRFAVLLKYDSRVSAHNVRNGILKDSELKGHVSTLPDSASNLDHVRMDDGHSNGSAQ
jgi:hypothetical protein